MFVECSSSRKSGKLAVDNVFENMSVQRIQLFGNFCMCFRYIRADTCGFSIFKLFGLLIAACHKTCIFCGHGNENVCGTSDITDLLAASDIYGRQQWRKT